jgi:hypothetical protein
MNLDVDTINFGKYKGLPLAKLLRDRSYCAWFLMQEKFKETHEYIYNRIRAHNPLPFFIDTSLPIPDRYFALKPCPDFLSDIDKKCYEYYASVLELIRRKIEVNRINQVPQLYDIKAPSGWLNAFEKKYELSRELFKEFITAHDLPNITTIIEEIKALDGIEYKGAKSYLIAKENSLKQEEFWGKVLKDKYGESINAQFVYEKCIFDFINISTKTVYECKLGLKDFNESQYKKYTAMLADAYTLVYLVGHDTAIDLSARSVRTVTPAPIEFRFADVEFTVTQVQSLADLV